MHSRTRFCFSNSLRSIVKRFEKLFWHQHSGFSSTQFTYCDFFRIPFPHEWDEKCERMIRPNGVIKWRVFLMPFSVMLSTLISFLNIYIHTLIDIDLRKHFAHDHKLKIVVDDSVFAIDVPNLIENHPIIYYISTLSRDSIRDDKIKNTMANRKYTATIGRTGLLHVSPIYLPVAHCAEELIRACT